MSQQGESILSPEALFTQYLHLHDAVSLILNTESDQNIRLKLAAFIVVLSTFPGTIQHPSILQNHIGTGN